jgi:hypothetical protein
MDEQGAPCTKLNFMEKINHQGFKYIEVVGT